MRVYLTPHGPERHRAGCLCRLCDGAGESYGVALNVVGYDHNPLVVFYAATAEGAMQDACAEAARHGWTLVPAPEE